MGAFFVCIGIVWAYTYYLGLERPTKPGVSSGEIYPLHTRIGIVYVTQADAFIAKYVFTVISAGCVLGLIVLGFIAVCRSRPLSE
jgi:hypothetical protein